MGTLLKNKYREAFIWAFASLITIMSRNSVFSCKIIWDCVKNKFYNADLGNTVNKIEKNLKNDNFVQSFDGFNVEKNENDILFEREWFTYYFSRLPILMQYNRFIHEGKRKKFDFEEVEIISKGVLGYWYNSQKDYIKVGEKVLDKPTNSFFDTQKNLCKFYISKKKREDFVYDDSWLWPCFNELYRLWPRNYDEVYQKIRSESQYQGEIVTCNIINLALDILSGSFPMYWNTLSSHYVEQMIFAAQMGYFIGDLDTEELVREFER